MLQQSTLCEELEIDSPALAPLISYPKYSEHDWSTKLSEMRSLGVRSIIVGNGRSTVNGISVAGKGCVGLVFKAKSEKGVIALKVRRTDADRESMEKESFLQKMANGHGVGPAYLGHTSNLVAMEFVEGQTIREWIKSASEAGFRKVARSVLDQCYALDAAGLDHGELSRLGRHVIVSADGRPYMIDFESASTARRPGNVTCAAQALFLFGAVATHSKKIAGEVDSTRAVNALRDYKRTRSRTSYYRLVEILGIAF